ncbi:hypothetical protein Tco_1318575 [Tanacetum coccineum]
MNALTLRSLIDKEKLIESNFLDWNKNLRITLKYEGKLHHIDSPLHEPHATTATPDQVISYQALLVEQDEVTVLMLACMTLELQKEMENCQSVSSHVLKMKSFIDKLEHLGHPWSHVLAVNTVLGSVTKSFDNFVMNYNMHGWDNKSLGELHLMLKTAKKNVLSKSVVSSCTKLKEAAE